ncbi:MAG TPA: hypothetical protein VM580_29450 [Labilithrix sp.]|nr:hypothetical protein [Labilithrix sp.]
MKIGGRFLVAALAVPLLLSACDIEGTCNDCGSCGIGGPVYSDTLVRGVAGLDNGVPTVALKTLREGTCTTDPGPTVWVQLDHGMISTKVPADGATLDRSTVAYDASGAVIWKGTTLSVTSAEPSALRVTLVFKDGTTEISVDCTTDGQEPTTCAVDMP